MEKEYLLKNLECPHCVNKIETSLKKIDGITSAEVNFFTTTLLLTLDKDIIDLDSTVKTVVNKYEPDVIVTEKQNKFKKKVK